jgi:xylulokinase
VFFGLTARHNRFHLIRAILEGVVYSLRDSFEILKEMGVPIQEVRASGGGARSDLWRQIQADIYGREVVTISAIEGPAYGAALLAGAGVGVFPSVEEACRSAIRVVGRTAPIPQNVEVYDRFYPIYRELYGALKPHFDAVTELVAGDCS